MASSNPDEQMVKGQGARDRSSGNSGSSGGGERGGGSSSAPRSGGDRSSAERRGNDDGGGRVAAGRGSTNTDANRDNDRRENSQTPDPVVVTRAEAADHQRVAVPRQTYQSRGGYTYRPPLIVRHTRPTLVFNNYGRYYGPRYYAPSYYHRWAGSYYGWSPISYAPWPLIYGSIGFSNFGFYTAFGTSFPYGPYPSYAPYAPYAPYPPYAYPWQVTGTDIGGIRLRMQPRDAQVFVDGNYAGIVDDFDGSFQSLRLQEGGHKIEIHMPGYEDLELDVHVQAGKTITLQDSLRPRP